MTDANPSMNIKKTLFKKDNEKDSEALLKKLIKSTTIPEPEKEQVMLALTNNPHSSNKIINIIEKSLGHKVTKMSNLYRNQPLHHHLHNLIQNKQQKML